VNEQTVRQHLQRAMEILTAVIEEGVYPFVSERERKTLLLLRLALDALDAAAERWARS
jgi:hypothetical protein